MAKPIREFRFRLVQGMWRDVLGLDGEILADVLEKYELQVCDKCEFARFKDYERGYSIWYRVNGGSITLTIWQL